MQVSKTQVMAEKSYIYQAGWLVRNYLLADHLVAYTSVLVGIYMCKMVCFIPIYPLLKICLPMLGYNAYPWFSEGKYSRDCKRTAKSQIWFILVSLDIWFKSFENHEAPSKNNLFSCKGQR